MHVISTSTITMNFFNRNRTNTRQANTEQLSPTSPLPPDPIPVNHIALARKTSNPGLSGTPPPTSPSSVKATKRDVLLRFKAVFNKPSKNTAENSQTAAVPDPDKIARREARRAARQKALQEWEEANQRRRKEALVLSENFEPLPKPPHVPSDSEDEAFAVTSANIGPDPVISAKGPVSGSTISHPGHYLPANVQPVSGGDEAHAATGGAYLTTGAPTQQQMSVTSGAPQPHLQQLPTHVQRDRNDAHLADSFGIQAYMGVDSQTAEAYTRRNGMNTHGSIDKTTGGGANASGGEKRREITHVGWGDTYGHVHSVPVYGSPGIAPLGPMAGARDADFELTKKIRKGRDLGRLAVEQEEKGNLGAAENGYLRALEFLVPAVQELNVGGEMNKQARMSMKKKIKREAAAMLDRVEELRVFLKANGPAVPSELPAVPGGLPSHRRESVRHPPKGSSPPPPRGPFPPTPKGPLPPIPKEAFPPTPKGPLPPTPKVPLPPHVKGSSPPPPEESLQSHLKEFSSSPPEEHLSSPPASPFPSLSKNSNDAENEQARENLEKDQEEQPKRMNPMPAGPPKCEKEMPNPPSVFSSRNGGLKRPPPPPPPAFVNDPEDLLKRLASRQEIFSSASGGFGAVSRTAGVKGLTENPGSKPPTKGASCFMCGGVADLVAPCDHTFCEPCGKQVVDVFQRCPVPGCGEPLSMETCSRIQ